MIIEGLESYVLERMSEYSVTIENIDICSIDDAGLDWIDILEISYCIERKFNVTLSDYPHKSGNTIRDFINWVEVTAKPKIV